MKIISAEETYAVMSPADAVAALRETLRSFDPADDVARQSADLAGGGSLLMMPSSNEHGAGIKIITMNPESEKFSVPMIQGNYVLFEEGTLTPVALIDGAAITSLRTPAVSIAGVLDFLEGSEEPLKVAILGTGPQGYHHLTTLNSVFEGKRAVQASFISCSEPEDLSPWADAGSDDATRFLAEAELIICATTSPEPILTADQIRSDAVVVALGSHTPQARELPGELMEAAQVIVEDQETALRECGDIIQAIDEGKLSIEDTVTMREVVLGQKKLNRESPIVFKFSGMGWEDLSVAQKIFAKAND